MVNNDFCCESIRFNSVYYTCHCQNLDYPADGIKHLENARTGGRVVSEINDTSMEFIEPKEVFNLLHT